MSKLEDLVGRKFSRLTVIRRDTDKKPVHWICECECGKIVSVSILRSEANANNKTTGVRGVSYIESTGKYVAYITYKKKRYTLKRSADLTVCIKARKEAEEKIRSDFLEWFERFKEKE